MRLLQSDSHGRLSLTRNLIEDIPSYSILSHTWGTDDDEVTLADLENGSGKSKKGYNKLRFIEQQSKKDGLQYFWVDTCCIDKANHTELAEAIVSMFQWYKRAVRCYVYLSDVSSRKRDSEQNGRVWESAFRKSKWFTRGWTLQELIAPRQVEFYSRDGDLLGDKTSLEREIHEITRIPVAALRGSPLSDFSPDEKMRWSENRYTKRIEDKAYCRLGIFDVSMSPIYGEEEKAMVRLKDEICKSYRRQLDRIGHDTKSTSSNPDKISLHGRRESLVDSLGFDQMDSRRSTIKTAHPKTCEWLLKHPAYADWTNPQKLHEHRGFLWINGKPGAGKSTLIKFAHACAAKNTPEGEIILSFFFNARGDELEKSTVGMYRALLFQLLKKDAELRKVLDSLHPSSEYQNQTPLWTVDLLCELLSAAVAKLGQRRLKCFIDALDECDEQQVQDMVVFFEELGQKALDNGCQLYICFASRHYPTIDIRNGRQLTLENEAGHGEDLTKYIQSHLRAGTGESIEEVRAQIREKANGVFMWAVLVINILNEEFRRGRIFAIKERLQEIPPGLSDLFRDILRKDRTNMTDLLLCLQWILFAKRPLRQEEFYYAMVAGLKPQSIAEWDPEYTTVNYMNLFVLSSSKGLAELTKSKKPTVQFIHESVRDFLIKDNGLCELWPELGNDLNSQSHDKLKECCQNYLQVDVSSCVSPGQIPALASTDIAKSLRQDLADKFPFLDYASQHVLYHSNEAAVAISQDDFLRGFDLGTWIKISNLLERYEIRRHTPCASLLYILSEKNFARLITTAYRYGLTGNFPGSLTERYQYPLLAASATGSRDAVQALLTFADVDVNQKARKGRTALSLAAEKGYADVVDVLLAADDIDIGLKANNDRTPLIYAAEQGHGAVVQLLFDKAAVTNATHITTAVVWAATNGRETVMKLLLEKGANIEAIDKTGKTALLRAAEMANKPTVKLLLDKGANLKAIDNTSMTALLWAAGRYSPEIVHLLLEKGANIEATDNAGMTALLLAIKRGPESMVQLLLERNASVHVTDKSGRTTLSWALGDSENQCGVRSTATPFGRDDPQDYEEQMKLLDKRFLFWPGLGCVKTVLLLLAKGAQLDDHDENEDGKTALEWAAEAGPLAIARLTAKDWKYAVF
ncbi:hypothetical protein A1O3_01064 [Capronia epimyces CBS 606.96]|uniref:Uncharacterized protein n=1 Tax=Capronia epimyces CBS 606.96 TaxID=1182542 RepID=W9YHZ6_9EURO|nr:uncharacterized protein A1O3_01064 [Capronia epimyces CBS 606.96]EXJ92512.1 hypothetical protein A1O3_01064 [Capronia epimyces CBS 606.96]